MRQLYSVLVADVLSVSTSRYDEEAADAEEVEERRQHIHDEIEYTHS
jgi:hypothetical protein